MSANWWLNPFLCVDTETTGTDPFADRIVEVAAVDITLDGEALNPWCTLVDPGVEIPQPASNVHGISTARAQREGIEPRLALEKLAARIYEHHDTWHGDAAVVIYNATFDWPLLICEAGRYGVDLPPFAAILDPLLIDRVVDRYRAGGRKLVTVAKHYGVDLSESDAHGGLADATAAGLVMRRIIDRYPIIGERSLATLWLKQVRGHEAWRADFEDYMRRNVDPDCDIPAGWPIPARAS